MFETVLFLLIALMGSTISGTVGIGNALIVLPFSPLVLPIKQAIAILSIYFIASNVTKIVLYRQYLHYRMVLLIWSAGVPCCLLGAVAMVHVPSEVLRCTLGLLLIVYLIVQYLNVSTGIELGDRSIVAVGGLSGFFSGFIGDGSAVRAPLLLELGLRKESFVGTIALSALLINFAKLAVYNHFSLISKADLPLLACLVICAVAGNALGRTLVGRIKPDVFIKVVHGVLFIVGGNLLFF